MRLVQCVERIKTYMPSHWLYWVTKVLLGIGFILSGLRKMPGVKFTTISIENPVGLFFEGMYQTGFYWNFIGFYQILVAFFLLTAWFQRLTPILLIPVSINIFLISLSLQMRGTPLVTGLMLLGNLFLLAWHVKYYLPIFKLKYK